MYVTKPKRNIPENLQNTIIFNQDSECSIIFPTTETNIRATIIIISI